MAESNSSEAVYVELGALLSGMPNLRAVDNSGQLPDATLNWMAELDGLLTRMPGAGLLQAELNIAMSSLINTSAKGQYATKIKLIGLRALAAARSTAPAARRGAFIPTGADFDAFSALAGVFKSAKNSVLVVDPYMDDTILPTFAVLANEGVTVALLTDRSGMRPALEPAAKAWIAQYGSARHLRLRAAAARTLHDRVLIVDSGPAWILTQSLKDFAARSPATMQQVDAELAAMKLGAYTDIWNASEVIAET